jgi:hypothetical protein
MLSRRLAPALALSLLVTAQGCAGITDSPIPVQDGGGGQDVIPLPDYKNKDFPVVYACDTIDILFVIDNSNTMKQEQENLLLNFPKFIQRIEAITPKVQSYRIGVISTDIGAGPYQGPLMGSCIPNGDAGKLKHAPTGAACAPSYPKWIEGPGPTVSQDVSCIANLGVGGCGYEQQMEAALRALKDQPYNAGFMRKNAPIAIIFITDEDDCSALDTKLFDPNDSSFGPYPSRCVKHMGKLHPVSRYVQAFKKLKDNEKRVVVAAITGPTGKAVVDPVKNTVVPVCSSPALGEAGPGNRFDTLIKAFGDRGVTGNICQGDLAGPLDVIGKAIERACLK